MARGRKTGGRAPGTPNKASAGIKELLAEVLPDERLKKKWERYLNHTNPQVAWNAFKLYNEYRFGKPVQPVVDKELVHPIRIDISAIPHRRKLADRNNLESANQSPRSDASSPGSPCSPGISRRFRPSGIGSWRRRGNSGRFVASGPRDR
jgi:hypothetical protein